MKGPLIGIMATVLAGLALTVGGRDADAQAPTVLVANGLASSGAAHRVCASCYRESSWKENDGESWAYAQALTTGPGGATLHSVDMKMRLRTDEAQTPSLQLRKGSPKGMLVATLNGQTFSRTSSTRVRKFTAPPGTELEPMTTYFIVVRDSEIIVITTGTIGQRAPAIGWAISGQLLESYGGRGYGGGWGTRGLSLHLTVWGSQTEEQRAAGRVPEPRWTCDSNGDGTADRNDAAAIGIVGGAGAFENASRRIEEGNDNIVLEIAKTSPATDECWAEPDTPWVATLRLTQTSTGVLTPRVAESQLVERRIEIHRDQRTVTVTLELEDNEIPQGETVIEAQLVRHAETHEQLAIHNAKRRFTARACGETGAVCVDGRPLAGAASATIPGAPLTATLTHMPGEGDVAGEHTGSGTFEVRLAFNTEPDVSYITVRDTMFDVTGGTITGARRVTPPHDQHFDIVVKPNGNGAVSLSLASPLPACGAMGAVCTESGRMIEGTVSATVLGPVALSVADATVREGPGAKLAFVVSLDRAQDAAVTVDYATGDGEAKAGTDYVAASGTVTFAANATSKTVEVEVLADEVDEGSETMTLTLANASGARIADGEATGTIENTGHIPKAWITRFGRTVADQVLDAVDARLRAARTAGASVSLAGQRIGGAAPQAASQTIGQANGMSGANAAGTPGGTAGPGSKPASLLGAAAEGEEAARLRTLSDWLSGEMAEDDRSRGWSRTLTGPQVLMGSSFSLAAETDGGGFAALWGRMAQSRFAGREDALSLDGDVTTGLLGADYAWDRWTTGLVISHESSARARPTES